ncbi:MAG: DsrE family protein [Candidatus Eremiobacteraeota bacterium]|nr:DsrE family protein [Candidatus Eremiobacteraeota bacterium]
MRIGFLLSKSPHSLAGSRTFYHLALGALDLGHEVHAFCRGDGIYQALKGQQFPQNEAPNGSPASWWAALMARGVRVTVNELCAEVRGLGDAEFFLDGVRLGDANHLSELAADCDKVVCL